MKKAKIEIPVPEQKQQSPLINIIKIGAKIIFTIFAAYLIFTKTDIEKIGVHLSQMSPAYVLFALLILNFGQVTSAFRMKFYFATEKIFFRKRFVLSIYYIGMFFNRLLPGGIGGDGYIAYLLKKKKNISLKTSIRLLISSRASGLLQLLIFVFLLGFMSKLSVEIDHWNLLMIIGMLLSVVSYSFLAKKILSEKLATQITAFKYSIIVQGTVVLASASLFLSEGMNPMLFDYLMLFMISSLVTLIPISFGGAGMRELTFFYGAAFIGLNAELGIAVSLVYFLLDTVSSLAGLVLWNRIDKIPAFKNR